MVSDAEPSPAPSDPSDRPFAPLSDEDWKKAAAELRWQIESGNLRQVREPSPNQKEKGSAL
jgi:hypothetical protein